MTRRRRVGVALSATLGALVVLAAAATLAFGPRASTVAPARSDLEHVLDLSTQPPDIVAAYQYAEEHESLMQQIPCYCGCGKSLNHLNLFDCYVIRPGVYSDHASGCMVCGNETKDIERLAAEGRSAGEIRAWIDGEYSQYGPPTDTPKVRS